MVIQAIAGAALIILGTLAIAMIIEDWIEGGD